MPLLPQQQQQAPPQMQQRPPQNVQTGKQFSSGVYPNNQDEAEKFVAGIIKTLHNDKTRPGIMKQLTNDKVPIVMRIGSVAASVITSMLTRVIQKLSRKPKKSVILKAINMTVKEVAKMAEVAGQKSTPEERKQAAGVAGGLIEEGMSKGKGQQDQSQGPPQGQPMQGQPQQMQGQPQQPQGQPQQPMQGQPMQQRGLLGGMR